MMRINILKKLYRKRSRSARIFMLILLMGVTLFVGLMIRQTIIDYHDSYDQAHKEAQRLTTILEDHIRQDILATDLLLQQAVERQYLNALFGGNLPHDMRHHFNLWLKHSPYIESLVLIGEQGNVEIAANRPEARKWLDYRQSFSRFAPFVALQKDDAPPLFLMRYQSRGAQPFRGLLLVRRINKLNGEFGGIVMAVVDVQNIIQFFHSITTRPLIYMDLILNDKESIFSGMQHPRLWSGTQQLKDFEDNKIVIQADDHHLIFDKKSIDSLPLTVLVAIDEDDFLASFWRDRFKDISFLMVFILSGAAGSFLMFTMATQVARVEQSEQSAILASQAKSEFLANMSHELRTPLNAIIGFSEMMNAGYFGPLNAKQKERMADITFCGNHLLQLINDILEFSKGEAGRLDLVEEKVSISEIFDEALRIMNERIKSKGIKVTMDIPSKFPLLFADKRKLKQILINLLSNAVKFTPTTGTMTMSARLDPSGGMILEVSDTGIGIAEDDIPTALAVFGQVHRSQNQEGTGLGLPLCRMFTELHGGVFTLISALGVGTTIRMHFPQTRIVLNEKEELNVQLLPFPNPTTMYQ